MAIRWCLFTNLSQGKRRTRYLSTLEAKIMKINSTLDQVKYSKDLEIQKYKNTYTMKN